MLLKIKENAIGNLVEIYIDKQKNNGFKIFSGNEIMLFLDFNDNFFYVFEEDLLFWIDRDYVEEI
jgi:hypothetical protein